MLKQIYKDIYKEIKKYDNIVIARHIGVDPDAMASQIALRDSIKLTFPEKRVIAVGGGSVKFRYIGNLDKYEDLDDALLIVTDTPDIKRIDGVELSKFKSIIKIDHHPFIDDYANYELIEDTASSACEVLMGLIKETKLECDKCIAETLFTGLVADSNRFLFNSCTPNTFNLVSYYLENYKFDMNAIYQQMYVRPIKEIRLEGFISTNMVVTENGVGYIKITDDDIKKFEVDSAAAGNMVNNFNFIDEVFVWLTLTEDVKNNQIRVSIRSRGPVINKVAEAYNGGGHKAASGAKLKSFEDADALINDLDLTVKKWREKQEEVL